MYVYTLEYFIGVLGGYLGLFIGGSILGFFEFIESIMSKAYFGSIKNQIDPKQVHVTNQ